MSRFVKLIRARVDITKIVAYSYQHAGDERKPAVFLMFDNEPKRITLLCETDEQVDECVRYLDRALGAVDHNSSTEGYSVNPLWEHAQFVPIAELRSSEAKLKAATDRIAELEAALTKIRSGGSANAFSTYIANASVGGAR